MNLDLVTIPKADALSVFTTAGAIDPFLSKVRGEIDAFTADVSTARGRKDIASFAAKISKVKVYLDDEVGKTLAAEQKEIPKKIDACRKHVRDTLETWRDEVRKPLTDWENAEKERVQAHENAILRLDQLADMGKQNVAVDALQIALAKDSAVQALTDGMAARQRYEAEQTELADLRRQADERAKKDREEQIAREAAERAKRDAEEQAHAAVRRAEEAAHREREAAERREQDLKRAAEDAERRAAEAEETARRKQAQEKAAEEAAAKQRETNKQHRAKINRDAFDALVAGGIAKDVARDVLKLIIVGQVPHISIRY